MIAPVYNPEIHTCTLVQVNMGFGHICLVQWPNNGTSLSPEEERVIFEIAAKAIIGKGWQVADKWTCHSHGGFR